MARRSPSQLFARIHELADPKLQRWMTRNRARVLSIMPPSGIPTGAEAFSGGGLFALALDIEGVNVLSHCENWKPAVATLKMHGFADGVCDAWDWMPPTPVDGLDILAGGPPCQPWSKAGKRRGQEDVRNLWPKIIEWVDHSRPRVMVMENVQGIKEERHADFFRWWWGELDKLGYEGVLWDLFAADYGTPQRRPRTWFVAWPKGAPWGKALRRKPPARFAKPGTKSKLPPWVRAVDRLQDGCCGGFGYTSCAFLNNTDGMCRSCDKGSNYEEAPGDWSERALTEEQVQRAIRQWEKHPGWSLEGAASTVVGRKEVAYLGPTLTKGHGKGAQLAVITPMGVAPGCPAYKDGGMGELLRYMTVREAAKLSDVPQWYRFAGSEGQQVMQLGNGISVNMGRAVVQHVLHALRYPSPASWALTADPNAGLWSLDHYSACGFAVPRAQAQRDGFSVEPVYFASGSNHPGEIAGFADVGQAMGVAAPECGPACEEALTKLAGTGVQVFVDSGAFSEVKFGPRGVEVVKPITDAAWNDLLDLYLRLAIRLGPQLHVVAPDMVGNQAVTLERLERYKFKIQSIWSEGARIIVPLQGGKLSLAAFAKRAIDILQLPDVTAGIPSKKAATSTAAIVEFLKHRPPEYQRIHLLGLGPNAKRGPEVIAAIRAVAPNMPIFLDSVLIRAVVGRDKPGGRSLTAATDAEKAGILAESYTEDRRDLPSYTDMIGFPDEWLTQKKLKSMAGDAGLPPDAIADFLADPNEWLSEDDDAYHDERWSLREQIEAAWPKYVESRTTKQRKRRSIRRAAPKIIPPYKHKIAAPEPVKATVKARIDSWDGNTATGFFLEHAPLYRIMDEREVALYADAGPRARITGGTWSVARERAGGASFGADKEEIIDWGRHWQRQGRLQKGPLYLVEVDAYHQAFVHLALKEHLGDTIMGHVDMPKVACSTGLGCSISPWVRYGNILHAWKVTQKTVKPVDWERVLAGYEGSKKAAAAQADVALIARSNKLSAEVETLSHAGRGAGDDKTFQRLTREFLALVPEWKRRKWDVGGGGPLGALPGNVEKQLGRLVPEDIWTIEHHARGLTTGQTVEGWAPASRVKAAQKGRPQIDDDVELVRGRGKTQFAWMQPGLRGIVIDDAREDSYLAEEAHDAIGTENALLVQWEV